MERGGWKEERLGRWGVVELVLAAIAGDMGVYLFPPCVFAAAVIDTRATSHGERGRERGEKARKRERELREKVNVFTRLV